MNDQAFERATKALERVALVLAALYGDRLENMKQGGKAERLSRLGFTNAQIADALGTSENSINVSRVGHRKKSRTSQHRGKKSAKRKTGKRK